MSISTVQYWCRLYESNTVVDPREEALNTTPLDPISSIFIQFSAKLCQIIGWRTPTPLGWRSTLGNPGSSTGKWQLYFIDLLLLCFSTHVFLVSAIANLANIWMILLILLSAGTTFDRISRNRTFSFLLFEMRLLSCFYKKYYTRGIKVRSNWSSMSTFASTGVSNFYIVPMVIRRGSSIPCRRGHSATWGKRGANVCFAKFSEKLYEI